MFGIGERKGPEIRERMCKALQHAQVSVKNLEELFKVYRSEGSWLATFTAPRLPSARGCISSGHIEQNLKESVKKRRL